MTDEERQATIDGEHLRVLSICYVVSAGMNAFFSLFGLLYASMGLFFTQAFSHMPAQPGNAPPPAFVGMFFGVFGLGIFAVMMGLALLKLLTAKRLKQRRSRLLCMAVAAVSCFGIPVGTALGVFTFLVLSRESIARTFDAQAPPLHVWSMGRAGPNIAVKLSVGHILEDRAMTTNSDPGFEIVPGVLPLAELGAVASMLAANIATRSRAGARHLLGVTAVGELAMDERLLKIATRFLGATPMPFRATLFDKSAAANWLVVWHQDTALPLRRRVESSGWGPWSIKAGVLYAHAPAAALAEVVALRVHLDDSTSANGPLRVLPGSHTLGVLSDERIAQLQQEIAPVECLSPAGGVVAMRPLVVHASSKSRETRPRRVLHIEYATQVELAPDIELAVA